MPDMRGVKEYSRQEDETVLQALFLKDHVGLTMKQISERFGRTKNSIVGMTNRVTIAANKSDNKHLNGTMAPDWWKK